MKVWKLALLAPLGLLCLLPGPSAHTLEPHAAPRQNAISEPAFALTITGQRQGSFAGDGSVRDIRGLSYELEVIAPTDPASGQATGRRQYKPLTITKEWGASSPQILTALATNAVALLDSFITGVRSGVTEIVIPVSILPGTTLTHRPE